MARVERDLVQPQESRPCRRCIVACLERQRDQCSLHRVAVDNPVFADLAQVCVVAEEHCQRHFFQDRIGRRVDRLPADLKTPFGLIAGPLHFDLCQGGHDLAHGHLVAGQRTGLVGADHRHRAERLNGREAPNNRIAACHTLDADRQRDRHDRRQAFRYRCNGQPNHRHKGLVVGIGLNEDGIGEHQN